MEVRDALLASVRAFVSGAQPTDDMTVLVLRHRRS
jgi:serine phosphatase RsbU (regulator of sigma subunit)